MVHRLYLSAKWCDDAFLAAVQEVRAMLGHLIADYPALGKLLGRKMQPTPLACYMCKVRGVFAWVGKTLYGGFYRWLPASDPARRAGHKLNYKPLPVDSNTTPTSVPSSPRTRKDATPTSSSHSRRTTAAARHMPPPVPVPAVNATAPAARTKEELTQAPRDPGGVVSINNEELCYCAFWRLPYFDPMLMSSPDPMHTIAGVMKSLFECMGGNNTDTVAEYEIKCNK